MLRGLVPGLRLLVRFCAPMDILRTPDSRFSGLPGYAYSPKYRTLTEHHDLRMHYVDVGPPKGRPILLLHGEPSWSYLYRHMIPILAEAGYRAIAPDLIGFGRSDKPTDPNVYSYESHDQWLTAFLELMDLKGAVLFCQDWGGLLGLRQVARDPGQRFSAVIACNTFFPSGREPLGEAFYRWQKYSQDVAELDIAQIIQKGCTTVLTEPVRAAYNAPFVDESYKVGARRFPMLVPTEPSNDAAKENQKLWARLGAFEKPFVTAFSDGDPITKGADQILQLAISGAKKNDLHTTIKGAGHFAQEDRGPELAAVILEVANGIKPTGWGNGK